MSPLMNMLACLLAMLPAPFLWQGAMPLRIRGAFLGLVLLCFECFIFFAVLPTYSLYEILPLEMLAMCLCVSTLFLKEHTAFFAVLSQCFWLWIVFFGTFSLSYRVGASPDYIQIAMLVVGIILSPILSSKKQELRFCMTAYWAGIWVLAFTPV